MDFVPRFDIALLSKNLSVSKSAVDVPQSPRCLILFPPTANIVLFFLDFTSLASKTNLPYITFLN